MHVMDIVLIIAAAVFMILLVLAIVKPSEIGDKQDKGKKLEGDCHESE